MDEEEDDEEDDGEVPECFKRGEIRGIGEDDFACSASSVRKEKQLRHLPTGVEDGLLSHLVGARCVLTIWILADHFLHGSSVLVDRANVAVDCFIIMSGFVTHWAYGARELHRWPLLAQFYVRRILRVLLTTYLAMGVAAALMIATAQPPDGAHMLRCILFVESWLQPENWCPNGQTWTIAALLPSWLLYPAWRWLLEAVEARGGARGLAVLLLGLWASSLGPSLFLFLLQGGWLSMRQHNYAYVWPPSQLADFAVGATAASLARLHGSESSGGPGSWWRGCLADVALALILVAITCVPYSGYHVGWEPLFNHALAPVLATFLYGSSADGCSGIAAWVLSRRPLVRLGKYSFEIFLFQQPLFSAFEVLWIAGLNEVAPKWCLGVLFMITLFVLSGLYAEHLEAPFVQWLRQSTAHWA